MKKIKYYTIGEIFRLGLLRSYDGTPYKHKASVSNIVNKMKTKTMDTKWGPAKVISEEQIEEYNSKSWIF